MTREFRPFLFDAARHRLAADEATRAADIRDGTLTLVRQSDGARRVIRAADVNLPLPAAVPPPSADRQYDFRTLVERALELEFTDAEVIEIMEIARRHRLLREPPRQESAQ
ncbi:MAG: hypothetical protein JXQ29_10915 [Planctomycetes bacterium]|nr:hypothetical protein [Planctomycetota bacterium]